MSQNLQNWGKCVPVTFCDLKISFSKQYFAMLIKMIAMNLTTLIDMNYTEYLFQNYCDADINQTREYVCSR